MAQELATARNSGDEQEGVVFKVNVGQMKGLEPPEGLTNTKKSRPLGMLSSPRLIEPCT